MWVLLKEFSLYHHLDMQVRSMYTTFNSYSCCRSRGEGERGEGERERGRERETMGCVALNTPLTSALFIFMLSMCEQLAQECNLKYIHYPVVSS